MEDIIIKICIVGEPSVGKTSMLYQYVFKKFDINTKSTIGCDFSTKIKSTVDGRTIRLQLWDIAGQERFNAVSKMYIRGALGCMIVCSSQDQRTVDETLKWKRIIEENCDYAEGQTQPIPTLLVQNKTDLLNPNDLKEFQKRSYLEEFVKKYKFSGLCCTSAKNNENIEQCFQELIDQIVKRGLIKQLAPGNARMAKDIETVDTSKKRLSKQPKVKKQTGCC